MWIFVEYDVVSCVTVKVFIVQKTYSETSIKRVLCFCHPDFVLEGEAI